MPLWAGLAIDKRDTEVRLLVEKVSNCLNEQCRHKCGTPCLRSRTYCFEAVSKSCMLDETCLGQASHTNLQKKNSKAQENEWQSQIDGT